MGKKIAVVVMGEPTAEFKGRTHSAILAEKQKKAREEARKQWQVEQRNKKRKAAHDKKEEENKSADAMETDKGADAAAEEKKVEEAEETVEEAMQKAEAAVELTEEEKNQWFNKSETPDLEPKTLSSSFSKFSLPDKSEGFDEIRYAWQQASAVNEY